MSDNFMNNFEMLEKMVADGLLETAIIEGESQYRMTQKGIETLYKAGQMDDNTYNRTKKEMQEEGRWIE